MIFVVVQGVCQVRETFPGRTSLWTQWSGILWTALSTIVRQCVSRLLSTDCRWCFHRLEQKLVCQALCLRFLRKCDEREDSFLWRRLEAMLQALLQSFSYRIETTSEKTICRQSGHGKRNHVIRKSKKNDHCYWYSSKFRDFKFNRKSNFHRSNLER